MNEIRTERLILRPFREQDSDDLYESLYQLREDEFEAYPDLSPVNTGKYLAVRLRSEEYYAVELQESGKVIGNIYYGKRPFRAREVGYIIHQDYRRQGYALEALRAVVTEAFRSGEHRVYAECDPRNQRSWRLLEKAGFVREAQLRQNIYFHKDEEGNPIWKDSYVYALLQTDRAAGES